MFRRFERQPPRLDPTISVVAGEILDTEDDAAKLLGLAYSKLRELRFAGRSPVLFSFAATLLSTHDGTA